MCVSGSIPSALGLLSSLSAFSAYSNKLTSSIPSHLANASALMNIKLYSNSLEGLLSAVHRNIVLDAFQHLGEIPSALCTLSALTYVALRMNGGSTDNPGFTCTPQCLSSYSGMSGMSGLAYCGMPHHFHVACCFFVC